MRNAGCVLLLNANGNVIFYEDKRDLYCGNREDYIFSTLIIT